MRPLAFALVALALTPGLASAQPQCTSVSISASPTRTQAPSGFFNRDGGVGVAYVTGSAPDCTWTAAADMPWVTFPDGTTGVGAAWLRYAVAAWPPSSSLRSANISITSATRIVNFNISQDGRAKGDSVGSMQSPAGWNSAM